MRKNIAIPNRLVNSLLTITKGLVRSIVHNFKILSTILIPYHNDNWKDYYYLLIYREGNAIRRGEKKSKEDLSERNNARGGGRMGGVGEGS